MAHPRTASGRVSVWVTLAIAIASVLATWLLTRPAPVEPAPMQALSIALPDDHAFVEAALSPDGTKLVYAAVAGGRVQLFLRSLDTFRVEPLAQVVGISGPAPH